MNETYEKEIDLKWLIYRVLRAWRPIVVWAVIIALALGVGSFGLNAVKLLDEDFMEAARLNFEREHAAWVATKENFQVRLDNLEEAKNRQQEYNDKSIMMKIDPLRKNVASFELYVKYDYHIDPSLTVQNPDLSSRILRAYATYMTNGEMYHYIMENLSYDIELRYLTEILGISVDYDNNFITISVVHADAAACQEILSLARTGIESRTASIVEMIDEHSISMSNQVAYETIDLNLQDTQEANLQYITQIDNSIQSVNLARNEWLAGVDKNGKEIEGGGPEPEFEYTLWEVTKNAIKMIIIGGVVGAVLVVAVIAGATLLSGKLLNPEDLKNCFGLRIIGKLPQGRVKQPFAFVSRIFAKVGGVTTRPEDYVPLARMVGSSIRSDIAAREDAKEWQTIAFTGTMPEAKLQRIVELMAIGGGFNAICASDMLTDASSVEKVSGADCVVLVETQEKSLMADVKKELEALKAWNKPVLGAVVLNTDAVM